MKFEIFNSDLNEIIVFFNGFALDANPFWFLQNQNKAILQISSYNDLKFNFIDEILIKYNKKYLISYSLGVFVAAYYLLNRKFDFEKIIAINGTLKPIDEKFGINLKMFDLTIKLFDNIGNEKFYRNMFDNEVEYNEFMIRQPFGDALQRKEELIFLKNLILSKDLAEMKKNFNQVYISKNDRIMPYKSQKLYWEGANVIELEAGHFPFYKYKNIFDV